MSERTDPIAAARALIEPLREHREQQTVAGGSWWEAPEICTQAADAIATLADALEAERAKVAAAYEAVAQWHEETAAHDQGGIDYSDAVGVPISNRAELAQSVKAHTYSAYAIRALTPADAQAALDKMLAKARLEGWRAGRDAAAQVAEAKCAKRGQYALAQSCKDAILALREPKEASHD